MGCTPGWRRARSPRGGSRRATPQPPHRAWWRHPPRAPATASLHPRAAPPCTCRGAAARAWAPARSLSPWPAAPHGRRREAPLRTCAPCSARSTRTADTVGHRVARSRSAAHSCCRRDAMPIDGAPRRCYRARRGCSATGTTNVRPVRSCSTRRRHPQSQDDVEATYQVPVLPRVLLSCWCAAARLEPDVSWRAWLTPYTGYEPRPPIGWHPSEAILQGRRSPTKEVVGSGETVARGRECSRSRTCTQCGGRGLPKCKTLHQTSGGGELMQAAEVTYQVRDHTATADQPPPHHTSPYRRLSPQPLRTAEDPGGGSQPRPRDGGSACNLWRPSALNPSTQAGPRGRDAISIPGVKLLLWLWFATPHARRVVCSFRSTRACSARPQAHKANIHREGPRVHASTAVVS